MIDELLIDKIKIYLQHIVPISKYFNGNYICVNKDCDNIEVIIGRCRKHYKCSVSYDIAINGLLLMNKMSLKTKLRIIDKLERLEPYKYKYLLLRPEHIKKSKLQIKHYLKHFYDTTIKEDLINKQIIDQLKCIKKRKCNYKKIKILRSKIKVKNVNNKICRFYYDNLIDLYLMEKEFKNINKFHIINTKFTRVRAIKKIALKYIIKGDLESKYYLENLKLKRKRSIYEWYIKEILFDLDINFIEEICLDDDYSCINFKYDFFCLLCDDEEQYHIPFIIEYNGYLHYNFPFYKFDETKKREFLKEKKIIDRLKRYKCYEHRIPILIIEENIRKKEDIKKIILEFIYEIKNKEYYVIKKKFNKLYDKNNPF